ncbi:MAG TPA: 6-carboxytetrahydropterin synthase QueD [Planctomycetes bacterium]|nr:6-carboxytetrahydropterin synthase QueD [Planctomycetota bacterium]
MRVSREFTFSGAHRLPEYRGKCERLHGHTWRLRVTVRAPVQPHGIAFDFAELDRVVGERVLSALDHSDLNALMPDPSAERIAQWVWRALAGLPLEEVRVWESERCFVAYRGEGDDA